MLGILSSIVIIFSVLIVVFGNNQTLNTLRVSGRNGEFLKPFLIPRSPNTANHQRVQQQLIEWYEQLGWHVQCQQFSANTPKGPMPMMNLVFTKNINAKKRIVLSAHYDSKWSVEGKQDAFIGATDSAVPCAMIVELSHALNSLPNDNELTLQAVFFDGEEAFFNWSDSDSLYGSRELANLWARGDQPHNLQNMQLFILLDLLGVANPRIPNYSKHTAHIFEQMMAIEADLTKKGIVHNKPTTRSIMSYFAFIQIGGDGLFVLDDHVPFHKHGYRNILHIIPSPFPSVWHRLTDNADCLDDATISDLTIILYHLLKDLLARKSN